MVEPAFESSWILEPMALPTVLSCLFKRQKTTDLQTTGASRSLSFTFGSDLLGCKKRKEKSRLHRADALPSFKSLLKHHLVKRQTYPDHSLITTGARLFLLPSAVSVLLRQILPSTILGNF